MSLASGTRIGPYEVVAPLGAGGMGEVYRARDTKLGRDVAVKVLSENFVHDSERVARFQREAQLLAALNHPHIATIHGLEERDGSQFLVMELVEGETLAARLKSGPLAVPEALNIARQVANALQAAHEKGIIHRDLKPANIAFTATGQVKVLDFGLAKALGPADAGADDHLATHSPTLTLAATQAGVILGTAAYMAPEQARGKTADKRCDVWAFGCVLYEMLAGTRAFGGEDVTDTLANVLKSEPDWRALPSATPPSIRALLRGCLEKDRQARVSDIAAALFVLKDPASVDDGGRRDDVRLAVPLWRRAATYGAVAIVAAVLTALLMRLLAGGASADVGQTLRFEVDLSAQSALQRAVSPDGRFIAFTALREGRRLLWIRSLETLDNRALQGTEGAEHPFWSADSQWIGFGADGKLKRIAVSGGFPETLCDLHDNSNFRGGAWNRDDVILFGSSGGPLYRVPAAGGAAVAVTTLDGQRQETTHRWPSFLPGGRRFLFTARSQQPEYHGIYVGSLDSGERTRLVSVLSDAVFAAPGWLLFSQDGDLLAQRFDPDVLELAGKPRVLVQQVLFDAGSARASFTLRPHA